MVFNKVLEDVAGTLIVVRPRSVRLTIKAFYEDWNLYPAQKESKSRKGEVFEQGCDVRGCDEADVWKFIQMEKTCVIFMRIISAE